MLPLEFSDENIYDKIDQSDVLTIKNLVQLKEGISEIEVENTTKGFIFATNVNLSFKEIEMLKQGGALPLVKAKVRNQQVNN